MLVNQIATPVDSSGPASSPSRPLISPITSSVADQALATLSNPVRTRLAARRGMDSRLNRTGLAMISAISIASSRPGSSHRDTSTRLSGRASCSPIATITATATGQRLSPRVTRNQAGTWAWPAASRVRDMPAAAA